MFQLVAKPRLVHHEGPQGCVDGALCPVHAMTRDSSLARMRCARSPSGPDLRIKAVNSRSIVVKSALTLVRMKSS